MRVLFALTMMVTLVPDAIAQDEPSVDLAGEADLHFRLGVEAYSKGNYREALERMLRSNRLAPNKNVVFNIARCHGELGQYDDAYRAFAQFKSLATDPERVKVAQAAMDNLKDRVALVEVTSEPEGAEVYVDREDLGARGRTPLVLAVPKGEHTFILKREGFNTSSSTVTAVTGEEVDVEVELQQILAKVKLSGADGAEVKRRDSGKVLGTIPGTFELPPEPTVLVISSDGFTDKEILVSPVLGEEAAVEVDLDALTGILEINATQRGARVEVDGDLVGFTPVLANVPVGSHEVVVSAPGFQSGSRTVEVVKDQQVAINFPLIAIQEVVTGSGIAESILDAPASIVVISEQDILDRGYDNLAEILHDIPGFDNMTTNGTNYQASYQRGYRTPFTQRTLLLIDGRVDNHLWAHSANLSRQYPMNMIERIEVLYGPASAVYGANAFLGIINVVTKKGRVGEPAAADVKVGYGSWDTRVVDANVRGTAGEVRYSVSGRYFGSDEANLCGEWGFTNCEDFSNADIWGAFTDPGSKADATRPDPLQSRGVEFHEGYNDPTNDWGMQGSVGIGGLEIGVLGWSRVEGYGPYYASDRAHPAAQWGYSSKQLYARYRTDFSEKVSLVAEGGWRESRVFGDWAENFGGFLSLTSWSSISDSTNAKVDLQWKPTANIQVVSGLKFEHKNLQKAYDIPGYYDAFSSVPIDPCDTYDSGSVDADGNPVYNTSCDTDTNGDGIPDPRPGDVGYRYIYGSERDLADFDVAPTPGSKVPQANVQPTDDIGAYVQVIGDFDVLRINAGMRIDHNSFYHRPLFSDGDDYIVTRPTAGGDEQVARQMFSINPRFTAIGKIGKQGAVKFFYGEAFQEPAPVLVWGGWNGRNKNEGLIPEKARNIELLGIYRTARFTNEVSLYTTFFSDVIKEDAQNSGNRQVFGVEYRLGATIPNPIPESPDIRGYANYTFTQARSAQFYDFNTDADGNEIGYTFVDSGDPLVALGDIAPHKVNVGLTVPVRNFLTVHNGVRFISAREPYIGNRLRNDDYTFAPYAVWNAHVRAGFDPVHIGLKIDNVIASDYLVPGVEGANAGQDFDNYSRGFNNSAIPTPGTGVLLTADVRL